MNQSDERLLQCWNPASQVKPKVDRDLFVPRPAGMQAPASLADARNQLALDERVNVFVGGSIDQRGVRAYVRANRFEARDDRESLSGGDNAGPAERLCPCLTAGDVILDQTSIDGERLAEVEDLRVGGIRESA